MEGNVLNLDFESGTQAEWTTTGTAFEGHQNHNAELPGLEFCTDQTRLLCLFLGPAQFGEIIIRIVSDDRSGRHIIRVKDVARVELGAQPYDQ